MGQVVRRNPEHRNRGYPFNKNDIFTTLELVKKKIYEKPNKVNLKNGKEIIQVDFEDIFWIKADDKYIEIYTKVGKFVERSSIKKFTNSINSSFLIQTHRSYMVNKYRITSFTSEYIKMGSDIIPISRTFKENVENILRKSN